jgi:hypothetical protein
MKIIEPPKPWPKGAKLAVYGAQQPEYLPLPALRMGDAFGTVRSCWSFGWRDRLRVLVSGRVYLDLMTFGDDIQPQLMHHGEVEVQEYVDGGRHNEEMS